MPFKQPGTNTLQLVERIKDYIETRNRASADTGAQLFLLIDVSKDIRQALG